jgi:hypothetical protein
MVQVEVAEAEGGDNGEVRDTVVVVLTGLAQTRLAPQQEATTGTLRDGRLAATAGIIFGVPHVVSL